MVVVSQIGRIARRALHLLFVACCLVVTYILVVSFVFLLRIHSIRFEPGAIHAWYQAHDRTPYCKFAPGALFYTQGHAFRQYGRSTEFRFNSLGFRDREYSTVKGDAYRIIALGDSMTYGSDAPQDGVFPKVIERILNAAPGTHPRVEVLNLGNPGCNTRAELEWYERAGKPLQPDLVLWQVLSNDHLDDQFFHLVFQEEEKLIHRYLPLFYSDGIKRIQRHWWKGNYFYLSLHARWLKESARLQRSLVEENFLRPIREARAAMAPAQRIVFVIFSLPAGTETQFFRTLTEQRIEWIDLRQQLGLDAGPDPSLVLDPVLDHHLSVKGHEMVGRWIVEQLPPIPGDSAAGRR